MGVAVVEGGVHHRLNENGGFWMLVSTQDGPVTVPLAESDRTRWFGAGAAALLALGVVVARLFHPVQWWGWVGAALMLVGAVLVVRHRPLVVGCRLEGSDIVLQTQQGEQRIPAQSVARIVSTNGDEVPIVQTRDGRATPLQTNPLWQHSAYPTARVLAEWVKANGGGDVVDMPLKVVRKAVGVGTVVRFVILIAGAWLVLPALFGDRNPNFTTPVGWGIVVLLAMLVARKTTDRVTRNWTASEPWSGWQPQ